jgi:hypothetical protein
MKKWIFILAILVAAVVCVVLVQKLGLWKNMTAEELRASIEIVDVHSKWVEKYYQPWPPKLTLVPALAFKVKNISDVPLKYINFNATFRFQDDYENLGDSFLAAIRGEAVEPGDVSQEIVLKSNYGVEGRNLGSFKSNPAWKVVVCKLFAASKGSQYILMGDYTISREIDFKEPEPVGLDVEPVKKTEDTPQ